MSTRASEKSLSSQNGRGRQISICRPSLFAVVGLALSLYGCAKPNPVTIQLRKENQALQERFDQLQTQNKANLARIEGLEQQKSTIPTLPQSRLNQMFTVHGIQISRLTGGADLDPNRPGDEGLRIYLEPVDDTGDVLKATGQVTVEAFDLSKPTDNRIGLWGYSPDALKSTWRALGPIHDFVLVCPWQTPPQHPDITLKVTFRDELTDRVFSTVKTIKVTPPPTTQPTTRP